MLKRIMDLKAAKQKGSRAQEEHKRQDSSLPQQKKPGQKPDNKILDKNNGRMIK